MTASNGASSKRRDAIAWLLLAAILGVALFLRLDGLGSLGLGFDEPQHIYAARGYLDRVLPPPTVPFYGQWWFWTPLAAGVSLVLAVGAYLWARTDDVRLIGGSVTRDF